MIYKTNFIYIAFFIFFCVLTGKSSFSQTTSEPTSNDRFAKAFIQLTGALSLKKGLSEDVKCSAKKYNQLPIDNFIDLLIKLDDKNNSARPTPEKIQEMKLMILKTIDVQIPNQGVSWRVNYNIMSQAITASSKLNGLGLCDAINEASEGLFQKSLDNLRLIKN
jgi:hypothetical protein